MGKKNWLRLGDAHRHAHAHLYHFKTLEEAIVASACKSQIKGGRIWGSCTENIAQGSKQQNCVEVCRWRCQFAPYCNALKDTCICKGAPPMKQTEVYASLKSPTDCWLERSLTPSHCVTTQTFAKCFTWSWYINECVFNSWMFPKEFSVRDMTKGEMGLETLEIEPGLHSHCTVALAQHLHGNGHCTMNIMYIYVLMYIFTLTQNCAFAHFHYDAHLRVCTFDICTRCTFSRWCTFTRRKATRLPFSPTLLHNLAIFYKKYQNAQSHVLR